jgi:hypothetical protein
MWFWTKSTRTDSEFAEIVKHILRELQIKMVEKDFVHLPKAYFVCTKVVENPGVK